MLRATVACLDIGDADSAVYAIREVLNMVEDRPQTYQLSNAELRTRQPVPSKRPRISISCDRQRDAILEPGIVELGPVPPARRRLAIWCVVARTNCRLAGKMGQPP